MCLHIYEPSLSKAQKTQVYRFKASLWLRKGLWRRIEIQGGQTLADFDRVLRDAFEHDTFDHCYHYCPICKEADKQVIATWICITCSNHLQEAVYICENCAGREHEDHYIDEILY
jgi:hypothetical protein